MAIRASSASQIDALVANLASGKAIQRDAAVARLSVIGGRAVDRLIGLAESGAHGSARAAAFRALEAIGDERALEPALRALNEPDAAVAGAAAGVARAFVRSVRGARAVEGLTIVALDGTRPEALRVTAVRALADLELSTIAPLLKSLSADPSHLVRAEAEAAGHSTESPAADDPVGALAGVAERGLPDDPAEVRRLIARGGGGAALPVLLRIVERVRTRESDVVAARGVEWMMVRAAAHLALARRGSRVALYDLRESVEAASGPLPIDMLAALSQVGDQSCLEAIAAAHGRSKDRWVRDHMRDVFQTIARRGQLTGRHAVIRRIQKRWPKVFNKP